MFTELEAEVTEIRGVVDSAITTFARLANEIEANKNNPAKIAEIAAGLRTEKGRLAAAIANPGGNPPPVV